MAGGLPGGVVFLGKQYVARSLHREDGHPGIERGDPGSPANLT